MKLAIFALFIAVATATYVPGAPGAPWTDEELRIVKAKLYAIYTKGTAALAQLYGSDEVYNKRGGVTEKFQGAGPSAPKMLRLGFHDCLKYKDGTGGCDGCLNWHGVGYRYPNSTVQWRRDEGLETFEDIGETNNNGMEFTVAVLEEVYINPEYPQNMAPALEISLKNSGKSRADLWAFAAITAVEYGIETNNAVCDGTSIGSPIPQCNQELGTSKCMVNVPRPLVFQTGRKDCTEFGDIPYKATKEELHPNAVGNGKMTLDFFKESFDFNSQETVAIMGGHTMGHMHSSISLFRYLWTTEGTDSFNNHYYK